MVRSDVTTLKVAPLLLLSECFEGLFAKEGRSGTNRKPRYTSIFLQRAYARKIFTGVDPCRVWRLFHDGLCEALGSKIDESGPRDEI